MRAIETLGMGMVLGVQCVFVASCGSTSADPIYREPDTELGTTTSTSGVGGAMVGAPTSTGSGGVGTTGMLANSTTTGTWTSGPSSTVTTGVGGDSSSTSSGTSVVTDGAGGSSTTTPTPSLGCGVEWAPADLEVEEETWRGPAAQVVRREIEVAGVSRRYLVVVPLDYDPARRYPLIFAFHGRGGDREQLRGYMNIEAPTQGGAIVVYPEGLIVDGSDTGWDLSADSDDLLFFDALYEEYTQELCIDEERVFATGHSFGGCMTNTVGCHRGELLRGVAPVAGCGPNGFNTTCSGQVAAMIIHSPLDTTTDYASGIRGCNTYLDANQCDQSPECGCYWVAALESGDDECVQVAQEPYPTGQAIEVTDDDVSAPQFRQYLNCDPGYPVVQVDHENGRDPRYHNPPSWVPGVVWEFFSGLPDVD